jgi:hypothetical protein
MQLARGFEKFSRLVKRLREPDDHSRSLVSRHHIGGCFGLVQNERSLEVVQVVAALDDTTQAKRCLGLDFGRVSAEGVAVIPQCEECRKVWLPADEERWQAHWIDDGPEEKRLFYCPDCADPEFGGDA